LIDRRRVSGSGKLQSFDWLDEDQRLAVARIDGVDGKQEQGKHKRSQHAHDCKDGGVGTHRFRTARMSLLDDCDFDLVDYEAERIESEYNLTLDSSKIHVSTGVETEIPQKPKKAREKKAPTKRKAAPAKKSDKMQAMRKKHVNQSAAAAFEVLEATLDAYGDATTAESHAEAKAGEEACRETMKEIRTVCRLTAKAATEQRLCADLLKRLREDEKAALLVESATTIERLNGELKKQAENLDKLSTMFGKNSARIVAMTRKNQAADLASTRAATSTALIAQSDKEELRPQVALHQTEFSKIDAPLVAFRTGADGSLALTTKTQASSYLGKLAANKRYLEVSLGRQVPVQAQSVGVLHNRSSASLRMKKQRLSMERFATGQIMSDVQLLALAPAPTLRLEN